jgi:hypothetical protein
MSKTITIRIKDNIYDLFKLAADGEHRTISNFIEIATLNYLTNEIYVSDDEMKDILNNSELVKSLKSGLSDIKKGNYKIIE